MGQIDEFDVEEFIRVCNAWAEEFADAPYVVAVCVPESWLHLLEGRAQSSGNEHMAAAYLIHGDKILLEKVWVVPDPEACMMRLSAWLA